MAAKILDNGTLVTLGLVGVVAAAGVVAQRGAGSLARSTGRSVLAVSRMDDPYEDVRPGWYITNTEFGEPVAGPFQTEASARQHLSWLEGRVGAANKAGLYGSRSSMTCPGCGQPITFDQGFTECGGEGEGICAEAVFAFDQKVHGRPHAVAEWKEMWENKRMPTQKKCDAIMAAHNAVASGLYGSRSKAPGVRHHDELKAKVEAAHPDIVRQGGSVFHGWGLGPSVGPARYGWWARWPSGRLDYLGRTAYEAEHEGRRATEDDDTDTE